MAAMTSSFFLISCTILSLSTTKTGKLYSEIQSHCVCVCVSTKRGEAKYRVCMPDENLPGQTDCGNMPDIVCVFVLLTFTET
jgi:hypothetical protein